MKTLIQALVIVLLASPLLAYQGDSEGKIQGVQVVNFPKIQKVEGAVAIKGRIKHSELERREKIVVPPVRRKDTSNLIEVDPIHAEGFTSAVLSLQGELKSTNFTPGTVGAIFVPDEKPVIHALIEDRAILFPLEVKTWVDPGPYRYFTSESTSVTVGFPRYRVFLYNSTNKSVEINLYMYLTQ